MDMVFVVVVDDDDDRMVVRKYSAGYVVGRYL